MKIAITIPAFNEEKTIGKVLDDIKKVMKGTSYDYFLHVLDDGSRDNTATIAKKHGALVHQNKRNMGLIKTFQRELHYCVELGADIIVHTDADGQYPARAIPKLIRKVEQGYDLVIGSRFKRDTKHMNPLKMFGNQAFARVLSRMTKTRITDSTSGFRAFTKEVAESIDFVNTFTYTQEQLIKAARLKFKVVEVGIQSKKTRDSRLFKNPFEYAAKAWINIFRIYRDFDPLKFFGGIGLLFMGVGIIIAIILGISHFSGTLNLDRQIPSILLAIVSFTTGLQILLFGFLADQRR